MKPNREWSPLARWLLILALWSGLGVLFGVQLYSLRLHTANPMLAHEALILEVARWSTWALLTPLALRLSRRLPVRRKAPSRLATHVVASAGFSLVHLGLVYAVVLAILQGSTASGRSLPEVEKSMAPRAVPTVAYDFEKLYRMLFAVDFHVGVGVYWVIVAVDQSLASQRRAVQLESQLAAAQLQALRMQLNPHFLFNTLNAVAALVRKDPEAAEEMVSGLGDFLRLTLEASDAPEVSLREELRFLECYLQIERVRFQDRLTTTLSIDPAAEDARVPSLLLQPIVENAIRHGIGRRAEPGHVAVAAWREGDELLLEVRDDGAGLTPERSERAGGGVGLANTRARLEQLYGQRGRLEIESPEAGGARVLLRLPFSARSRDDSAGGEA